MLKSTQKSYRIQKVFLSFWDLVFLCVVAWGGRPWCKSFCSEPRCNRRWCFFVLPALVESWKKSCVVDSIYAYQLYPIPGNTLCHVFVWWILCEFVASVLRLRVWLRRVGTCWCRKCPMTRDIPMCCIATLLDGSWAIQTRWLWTDCVWIAGCSWAFCSYSL